MTAVKGWHIAGIAAAVCLIGGTILTTEVCKPAPTVSSTPTKSVLDSINDAIPTEMPSVNIPYDPLPGMTTTPRATTPRTTTTTSAPSKYDVGFAPSYSFAEPDAHKKCGVDVGRMQNLSATQARCLINSGQYVAKGESPPGAVQPGVKANAAGQVCTKEKPMWYYAGFPLLLLAAFLAWTSFNASRRGEHGGHVTSQFAGEPDLPPPPSAPTFDPAAAGGAQTPPPTGAPPPPRAQAHTHSYDDFDSEDY